MVLQQQTTTDLPIMDNQMVLQMVMVLHPQTTMDHPAMVSQMVLRMVTVLQHQTTTDHPTTVSQVEHPMDTVPLHRVPLMDMEDHPMATAIQTAMVALMVAMEEDKMVAQGIGIAEALMVAPDQTVLPMATELPPMVPPMDMAHPPPMDMALPPMVNPTVPPMDMVLQLQTTMALLAMVNQMVHLMDMELPLQTITDLQAVVSLMGHPMDMALQAPTELLAMVRMVTEAGATETGGTRRTGTGGTRTVVIGGEEEEAEGAAAMAVGPLMEHLSSRRLIR